MENLNILCTLHGSSRRGTYISSRAKIFELTSQTVVAVDLAYEVIIGALGWLRIQVARFFKMRCNHVTETAS